MPNGAHLGLAPLGRRVACHRGGVPTSRRVDVTSDRDDVTNDRVLARNPQRSSRAGQFEGGAVARKKGQGQSHGKKARAQKRTCSSEMPARKLRKVQVRLHRLALRLLQGLAVLLGKQGHCSVRPAASAAAGRRPCSALPYSALPYSAKMAAWDVRTMTDGCVGCPYDGQAGRL